MHPTVAESIGGMIWPRGYVGAAAFWNFDATTDPAAPGFVSSIWKLNDGLVRLPPAPAPGLSAKTLLLAAEGRVPSKRSLLCRHCYSRSRMTLYGCKWLNAPAHPHALYKWQWLTSRRDHHVPHANTRTAARV